MTLLNRLAPLGALLTLAFALTLTLAACDAADPAASSAVTAAPPLATSHAGARGPSVNGSGHLTIPISDGSDILRRFTVHARANADGEVTGRFNLHSGGGHFQGDVTCVNFFDNVAVLAGFVTANENDIFRLGGNFVTIVEDNGEGGGAPPDRVGRVLQSPVGADADFPTDQSVVDFACTTSLEVALSFFDLDAIEAGNIQVRP